MHELGYVHRDISAGNVLLVPSSSDTPKRGVLTDLEYAIDSTPRCQRTTFVRELHSSWLVELRRISIWLLTEMQEIFCTGTYLLSTIIVFTVCYTSLFTCSVSVTHFY